jgi:hypothetical protein
MSNAGDYYESQPRLVQRIFVRHTDWVLPRRRDTSDPVTEPIAVPRLYTGPPTERRSVATSVVTAMADNPARVVGERRFAGRKLLATSGIVATTAAMIFVAQAAGSAFGQHDRQDEANPLSIRAGDCLTWPDERLDALATVACGADHLFEVVDTLPLDDPADSGSAPAQARLDTRCSEAVRRTLASGFDPDGRFVIGALWIRPADGVIAGQIACGLQLPSIGVTATPFRGRVAELDQSRIWPAGTCLTLKPNTITMVPVDCRSAHAAEVAGVVDLTTRFGDVLPAPADQEATLREDCARAAVGYTATPPDASPPAVQYAALTEASWVAGSRKVACIVSTSPSS